MPKKYATAHSTHKKCFVCNRKRRPLHRIKPVSVAYAFSHFKIVINKDARCCSFHLDSRGLLRYEAFLEIKSLSLQTLASSDKILLDSINSVRSNPIAVFDRFKNMDLVDDAFCLDITGWKKSKFLQFSSFITSINDTSGRTKEELIAIYTYWLRKGLTQSTLAYLKSGSCQQDISRYLTNIRLAIYKDFVPYFLGADSRSREFFISHNNKTSIVMGNLSSDHLAIVVDGTYTRIEKSSNNQVQYWSYSSQKSDLLIKPFTVCCTDGYFIDCYGPFKANLNDAKIFEYILENDKDLLSILKPNKTTVYLDRGFRDVYHTLRNKYQFNALIPHCSQLADPKDGVNNESEKVKKRKRRQFEEELSDTDQNEDNSHLRKKRIPLVKQLSVEQTNNNRLVTKIRFIVEKQNSVLKNKKALDHIRNSVLGHIQIDYRIACAMSNFDHKSCCPDGEKAEDVAAAILEKIQETNHSTVHPLSFLMSKQLKKSSKDLVHIDLKKTNDLVRLSLNQLCNEVYFGVYQLTSSQSYIGDLVNRGVSYTLSESYINKLDDTSLKLNLQSGKTKIIVVTIPSRHQRGLKNTKDETSDFRTCHKVLVQYVPGGKTSKSIESYLCSCITGLRKVGCCVHVASLLYYLCHGRYIDIKLPAECLKSVFIDTAKNESPNKPRYIKHGPNTHILGAAVEDEYESFFQSGEQQEEGSFNDPPNIDINDPPNIDINVQTNIDLSVDSQPTAIQGSNNISSTIASQQLSNQDNAEHDQTDVQLTKSSITITKIKSKKNGSTNPTITQEYEKNPSFEIMPNESDHQTLEKETTSGTISNISKARVNKKVTKKTIEYSQETATKENLGAQTSKSQTVKNSENYSFLDQFKKHLPKWGARIEYLGEKDVFLSNTCSVDYFLLALWHLSKLNENILHMLPSNSVLYGKYDAKDTIFEIVSSIDKFNWDKAKEVWVNKIMQLDTPVNRRTVSIFGAVDEIIGKYIYRFQEYLYEQRCTNECELNNSIRNDVSEREIIFYGKHDNRFILTSNSVYGKCSSCHNDVSIENGFRFKNKPAFLIVEPMEELNIQEIVKETYINGDKYIFLFAAIVSDTRHFTAIFYIDDALYLVDDLKKHLKPYEPKKNNRDIPCFCFFYLEIK